MKCRRMFLKVNFEKVGAICVTENNNCVHTNVEHMCRAPAHFVFNDICHQTFICSTEIYLTIFGNTYILADTYAAHIQVFAGIFKNK